MRQSLVWVVAPTVLCITSICSANAADSGTLKGTVVDPTGAVVGGALVIIEHWDFDPVTRHMTARPEAPMYTDQDGRFSVELPVGDYDVLVSTAVFSPIAKKIRVKTGRETVLRLKLKFDPLTEFIS